MKNEFKIRKWLGEDYHLCVSLSGENLEDKNWKLFRKYPGYLTDDSEAIMTSETNTDEDLYKFAKKHRRFETNPMKNGLIVIIAFIVMIIPFINILLKNDYLKMFFWGTQFVIWFICIPTFILIEHNIKIQELEFFEVLKELKEKCEKDE